MSRYFPDCITDIKVVYVEDHPTDLFFEVINKPGDRKSRMTYSDITVVELTIWLQTLTLVSIIYIYIIYKWLELQLCSLPMVAITTVFQVLTDSESDDELQSPTQATEPSTVWKINGLKR